MNTELKNAIEVTDRDAQYDESAKRLLGQKSILAHILVKTVDEFKGMNPRDECYELHRLLGALLSKELTVDEKLNIIGTEYDIPMEEHFRKDVSVMCNLSQGIKEDGIAIGESIGEARIIINMHDSGFTAQQIADVTKKI